MEMGLFEQNVTDRENKPDWIADEPVTYELPLPIITGKNREIAELCSNYALPSAVNGLPSWPGRPASLTNSASK
jgi:hypothetical protein